MIRVLQRPQLAFQQYRLSLLQRLIQERRHVTYIRRRHITILVQGSQQFFRVDQRLMIQMLQKHILHLTDTLYLFRQQLLVEKLAYLESDLGVLIGIKGGNSGLCGSEGFSAQPFLLILVK